MGLLALDTSVAVPLLADRHEEHRTVAAWLGDRRCALTGHSLAETYAVLTRLPGSLRVAPSDVAALFAGFAPPLLLGAARATDLARLLAGVGVAGGAVYDGLVALAATEHGVPLATRDARARRTYEALGADVVVVA